MKYLKSIENHAKFGHCPSDGMTGSKIIKFTNSGVLSLGGCAQNLIGFCSWLGLKSLSSPRI